MYTCDAGDGILISYFNEYQHCQFPKHNHKRFVTLSMVIFVSIWATYLLPNNIQFDPDNKVHGANMGHIWADRTQVGPMLTPWTLLSGERARGCRGYIMTYDFGKYHWIARTKHWPQNAVIWARFSSLMAPEVVKIKISSVWAIVFDWE